ncbi:MAG: EFR1 family ferrodoxin [Oscillospiraceae bacterium]|jgi:ferredoxin|nr:EFR1 family ferrodoxin [Oscillospiraceae bacterium]
MIGIYFSGTGNTKHCIEKLLSFLDQNAEAVPMEDERAQKAVKENSFIILAYPVQYSNIPVMVRDFIRNAASCWNGKQVLCMATMGMFSGDGTGCSARLLKKHGAAIMGGLQIHMPDSVCDSKLLKKSLETNQRIVLQADQKIEAAAKQIKAGNYPKEGLGFFCHLAGLLGQRLWFYGKTLHYSNQLKIHSNCVGCGLCASLCPMKNITMRNGKPVAKDHCTMCYRCISSCPQKAITLLGKEVYEQCRFERYI